MTAPAWSGSPPRKPGIYWFRPPGRAAFAKPVKIRVLLLRGALCVTPGGTTPPTPLTEVIFGGGEWRQA